MSLMSAKVSWKNWAPRLEMLEWILFQDMERDDNVSEVSEKGACLSKMKLGLVRTRAEEEVEAVRMAYEKKEWNLGA